MSRLLANVAMIPGLVPKMRWLPNATVMRSSRPLMIGHAQNESSSENHFVPMSLTVGIEKTS